jgi:hypothetical protein
VFGRDQMVKQLGIVEPMFHLFEETKKQRNKETKKQRNKETKILNIGKLLKMVTKMSLCGLHKLTKVFSDYQIYLSTKC